MTQVRIRTFKPKSGKALEKLALRHARKSFSQEERTAIAKKAAAQR